MKVGEKIHQEGDKVIIQKVHNFNPELERAKMARDGGLGQTGESRMVGTVPLAQIWEWCKEAGVKWDDVHGRQEVVRKKLNLAENKNFRVWQGRY